MALTVLSSDQEHVSLPTVLISGGETGIRYFYPLKITTINPFRSLPCCATKLHYLIKVEVCFRYTELPGKVREGSEGDKGPWFFGCG